MMEPRRILLFGGTFDPPHNGHMALLESACSAVRPDLAVVEPAGIPPHKKASATPAQHRLAMARCFESVWPRVLVDDTEIRRGGKSYTVDTLGALQARWPGAQLYLAIGSDMLLTFRIWRHWQEILQRAVLVVHSRRGGDEPSLREFARSLVAEGGRVVFAPGRVLEVSSTQLRQALEAGRTPDGLLPPMVARYITDHGLYRPSARPEDGEP